MYVDCSYFPLTCFQIPATRLDAEPSPQRAALYLRIGFLHAQLLERRRYVCSLCIEL